MIAVAALVVEVLIVVGIPLLVERASTSLIHRAAPVDLYKVPIASAPPKLLGLVLGLILVYDRYGGPGFATPQFFVRGGPWDLSLGQFLAQRANPFEYGAGALYASFAHRSAGAAALMAALLLALSLVTLLTPLVIWPRPVAVRAALCNLATALVATYLTIYGVVLLFWLLYLLNFWTFALLVAILQYYRSRY